MTKLKTCYEQSNFNVLLKMYVLKKHERGNLEQIQTLQTRRIQRLLRHVLKKSRFYQRYYQEHGITLDNIAKVSLQDLPVIDKLMMMEHYDDFICDRSLNKNNLEEFLSNSPDPRKKYRNVYTVIHSSGSTGPISPFVYGPQDWAMVKALVTARVFKPFHYFPKKIRIAFIGATDGNYPAVSLASAAPSLFTHFLPLSISSPLAVIDERIEAFDPDILSGYSSGIHLLAQEQLKGNIAIRPERIICSAEPLTVEMRRMIIKAFGRNPVNFYAASESLAMAVQCDRRENLHLFTDWHIFEAVDADLRPVPAGTQGNLLLTCLYKYTQPLIRYRMNDEVAINQQPCACGSPFPTIGNLAGRREEFLWFDSALGKREFVHPSVLVEFFVSGLRKFQIVQLERNVLLMKVIIEGDENLVLTAIRRRMQEILHGKNLDNMVKLNLEVVQDIPNDPKTGKYRLIIPLTV